MRPQPRKRHNSNTSNTFLGAFGGGAIGDLIFPGLGTLGGALLGAFGAHDLSSRSQSQNGNKHRKRDKYDEEYDEGRRRRGEI